VRRLRILFDQNRLLGGTVILGSLQILASVAGLLRNRMLYSTFPTLGVTDVYFSAFRPSDFLFQACILSALGTVLVPVLAGERAKGRQGEVDRVLSATLQLGAVVFGGIALLLALGFRWIAPHLVQFHGDQLELYITLGRLALLSNFLFVFGTTFGQYLVASQRYWMYGITPVLYTLGTIAGTVFLTPVYGPLGPMLGTLAGALAYAVLRGIAVLRAGARLPIPLLWHPAFRHMGVLMLPRVLSLGTLQVQLLAFDFLASGLPRGSLSINAATRDFQSVIVGAVGIALAQAVYAPLSEAAARGERQRFGIYMSKALRMAIVLTIIGAVCLVASTPIAVRLVKLSHVLPAFATALAIYAVSIPLESVNHILLRASYALKDTLYPALATALGGIAAIVVAAALTGRIGLYGLAVAFVAGQAVQAIGLAMTLPGRMKRVFGDTRGTGE
jgi:putative peptidoglycan lipid II flippase